MLTFVHGGHVLIVTLIFGIDFRELRIHPIYDRGVKSIDEHLIVRHDELAVKVSS